MKPLSLILVTVIFSLHVLAQHTSNLTADKWVDSVFKSLSDEQRIAQLMVIRLSSIDPATKKITFYDKEVEEAVKKYNIGGICLFQGGPVTQAELINYFQRTAKTPILISIDAENGVGMRLDSVMGLPRQMMLGAVQNPEIIYQYGRVVGEQCKRLGIQVNYAPVVDINNNPDNPVINDRSFGEDKLRVAQYGVQYMKGLQDAGIMACAKHFPGHGDVSVDSHVDLPVINKNFKQIDTVELYPFKELFKAGVASVMVAHLYIPAIDDAPNRATSLSNKTVTKLLRKQLKYKGLSFTDALEMKGVAKYFPEGEASVQSLIAGNDMLCLPGDVSLSLQKINDAIHQGKLKRKELNARVKRVLYAKYYYGLANWQPVDTTHLVQDLNKDVIDMSKQVSENALTLLRDADATMLYPLHPGIKKRIAYIGIGLDTDNEFARRMRKDFNAHVYYFDFSLDSAKAVSTAELLKNRYDGVIVGVHNYNRYPANNFGISKPAQWLIQQLLQQNKTITLAFGNPYAIKYFCDAPILAACYDDNDIVQDVAADWLNGKFVARGKLPVTICPTLKYGDGLVTSRKSLPIARPADLGFKPERLLAIDSICKDAIIKQATPGCVVLVAKDGKIAYEKAFGYLTYDKSELVYPETLYDLASVTKICATTMAVMKLYDEGKLDLQKTLGDYLPWVRGSNKESLKIWDILLHQAGLKAYIPFYEETITKKEGAPMPVVYSPKMDTTYRVRVAENLYMRYNWLDTIYKRILKSDVGIHGKYIYSDNDFIFMGKIVEAISGKTLDEYVQDTYYDPLGMATTGFKPRDRFPLDRIAPTEHEQAFRRQLIRGDVHDPGAAMFGGVSGHAGLFSDAYDLAILEQLLLNGGVMNGQRFLKKETIDFFTAYHSDSSRRALGFDKPEKDNETRKEPYPCPSASPLTFGHTGFTGTCVWVDPKYNIIFIFLSNRVNPNESNKLGEMNVRGNVMEAVYQAMNFEGGK